VEWGTPGNEGLYFRLGELAGTSIGNGTIVDRYYNTVDIDHYRTGLRVDYDAGAWGIQTMASSLTSAEVFALRPYFRPLLASGIPLVRTLTIAATVAMDVAAPDTIDVDPVTKKPLSDSKNNLKAQLKPAWVAGVGANLEVFRNPLIEVIPFTDLNSFEARGMGSLGWHLGTFINLHPIRDVLDVDTRWEYRRFGGHYQPGYFSTLYEVEKFSFLDGGPKAAFLRSAARDGISVNGFYGSLDVNVLRTIRITGIAEKYDQDKGGNVMLRLLLPYIANLQFSAYYTKRGFGKFVDAFDPDGAMAIGMLRYKLQGPLYLQGSYTRQWRLVPETGKYDTTDNFNLGVGVDFRF
jgi:hypothetical protein